jgi:hypothetical protein
LRSRLAVVDVATRMYSQPAPEIILPGDTDADTTR